MGFENLTPELCEKAKACKTPEELLELAKEEGRELSDDELEAVSGGGGCWVEESETCESNCWLVTGDYQ